MTANIGISPVVTYYAINDGNASTYTSTVTLSNAATGSPTHYMASESSTFRGAAWLLYSSAPTFTLSSKYGTKTVWFKVKNSIGESAPISDSINYVKTQAPAKQSFALLQAFPSPANPDVWIPFTLSETQHVFIKINDANGKLVKSLDLGDKPSGAYLSRDKAAYWDGRNEANEKVASGIYFYTIQAGNFTATKKLVIAK